MTRRNQSLLLLVLTVALLVVVSTRVAPREASQISREPVDDPLPSATPTPIIAETPPPTPSAPQHLRDVFPELSLTDWKLQIVNNSYVLPSSFAPNVSKTRDEQYFDSRAVDALEEMLEQAELAGYSVCIRVGYRPFATQAYLFNGKASQIQWGTTMSLLEAEHEARKVVAYPGTSEHQLGLGVDLMDRADSSMSTETAAAIPTLVWLREHCAEYGFILRYPENKKEITGWYEPWHFRYVGEEAAKYIMEHELCLEEFIEQF